MNSFSVSVAYFGYVRDENIAVLTLQAIRPSWPISCPFPASTRLQMHQTSSFELVSRWRNMPSPTGTGRTTAPTLSAIRRSCAHVHLSPASTCLKIHETSSIELVSCTCDIHSHTDTRKLDGADTLYHTPLLHRLSSIPCVNSPPNACNEFVGTHSVFVQHC